MNELYHYNHNHDRLGRFASSPGGGGSIKSKRRSAALESANDSRKKKEARELSNVLDLPRFPAAKTPEEAKAFARKCDKIIENQYKYFRGKISPEVANALIINNIKDNFKNTTQSKEALFWTKYMIEQADEQMMRQRK